MGRINAANLLTQDDQRGELVGRESEVLESKFVKKDSSRLACSLLVVLARLEMTARACPPRRRSDVMCVAGDPPSSPPPFTPLV